MEEILEHLLYDWAYWWYVKPVVETLCIVYVLKLISVKNHSRFKSYCVAFTSVVFLLLVLEDSIYVFVANNDKKTNIFLRQMGEVLNIVYGMFEMLFFFKIFKYNLDSLLLKRIEFVFCTISFALGGCFLYIILDTQTTSTRIWIGEVYAGINYALLTIALTVLHYILFKRDISWMYTTPTVYGIFCYCTLSLLIFPTSAFFFVNKFSFYFKAVNVFHLVLLTIVCSVMFFTIMKTKEKENQTLDFT
ncbi:hypothetical protein EPD60_06730 [Flaviaesturariibacter flavus]|uniref:Uncharacterized protein n=1 Tax=Flaviaesturariibacter flavus TaxID=2502780 RepID=A0A4R1BKC4_9BACT|nr:hypothetical protein [Flaviaesturariibacter flavus]TCJ17875.1 hypothetical protein EPD60_06730 [Flaviaesturariibacter flavus]